MATIKSFTDIPQSQVLSKILPLESADQTWARIAIAGANLDVPEELQYRHNGDMPFQYYSGIGIPCWSLAALLEYLRKHNLFPEIKDADDYILMDITFYNDDEVVRKVISPVHFIRVEGKNILDACYEMIIRLNELNLL